jgi:hypothetical protein
MNYPRRSRWHYVAGALLIPLLLHVILQPDDLKRYSWLFFGLVFAWSSVSIFEFIYVSRVESRLGTPIIEQHHA